MLKKTLEAPRYPGPTSKFVCSLPQPVCNGGLQNRDWTVTLSLRPNERMPHRIPLMVNTGRSREPGEGLHTMVFGVSDSPQINATRANNSLSITIYCPRYLLYFCFFAKVRVHGRARAFLLASNLMINKPAPPAQPSPRPDQSACLSFSISQPFYYSLFNNLVTSSADSRWELILGILRSLNPASLGSPFLRLQHKQPAADACLNATTLYHKYRTHRLE